MLDNLNLSTFSIIIAVICVLWGILILTMPNPSKTKSVYLNLDEYKLENSGKLNQNDAIDEWYINNIENIIAIKYNDEKISEEEIRALLK